jgi:hypothetical protein
LASFNLGISCFFFFFGFCLSPGILENITSRKLDLFLSSNEGMGDTYSVGFVQCQIRNKSLAS